MLKTTPILRKNSKAYRDGHSLIINQGGQGCFGKGQLIVTLTGNIPIEKVSVGDKVKSYDQQIKSEAFNKVINVFKYENNKKTICIKLRNGKEIICTEDHEFFFQGGWVSLKNILSLWKDKNHDKMETNPRIQQI